MTCLVLWPLVSMRAALASTSRIVWGAIDVGFSNRPLRIGGTRSWVSGRRRSTRRRPTRRRFTRWRSRGHSVARILSQGVTLRLPWLRSPFVPALALAELSFGHLNASHAALDRWTMNDDGYQPVSEVRRLDLTEFLLEFG
jgi:hypothetical protein